MLHVRPILYLLSILVFNSTLHLLDSISSTLSPLYFCSTFTPRLLQLCYISSKPPLNLHSTSSPSILHLFSTSSPFQLYLWSTYGLPIVHLLSTYGPPMVHLWPTYGLPMFYLYFISTPLLLPYPPHNIHYK